MSRPSRLLVIVALVLQAAAARAQVPALDLSDPAVSAAVPHDQEVTLMLANRPILVLRGRVLTRMPSDRAATASQVLDRLVSRGVTGPVESRPMSGATVITVGGEAVLAVLPADVDVLANDTMENTVATAIGRLRTALVEAKQARTPRELLRGTVVSVVVTALLAGILWLFVRFGRLAGQRLARITERRMASLWHGQVLRATRLPRLAALVVNLVVTVTAGFLVYLWLTIVLRQFPYTRPWGESLGKTLAAQVSAGGATIAAALPGLLIVAIIVLVTRTITKGVAVMFSAVEQGRMALPGVYPDTAVATRRLVLATLWLLAAAIAYPHVPGSDSSAFKGLSVFVGVVVSLGSSGVMQHMMSGLMLTFSRAVHPGEFARIGDVVGTVVQLGTLATKIRTPYGEEITIPNAVVVSQTITNYSKTPGAAMPLLTTSVTIGYDTPWRQVEGLLLKAARQTPGVQAEPKPFVWREALEDYYVKYTLLVAPEDPCHRAALRDALHVRILDAFNEYGVQIMSPHYIGDPRDLKVVPPSRWHEAPAEPPAPTSVAAHAAAETSRRS